MHFFSICGKIVEEMDKETEEVKVAKSEVYYRNVYDAEYDSEWRQYVEDEQYFKEQETYELEDGYSLDVRSYALEGWDGDRLVSCHRFSQNVLKKNGEAIHSFINVDYQVKPFSEFLEHSNGHRYFAYHRDLYGISYFDLDTKEVYDYIPEGNIHDQRYKTGESFIITDIHYDKAENLVAYGGCYWAGCSEVMIGELSDPLNFVPYLVNIHELVDPDYENYDDIDFVRWEKDTLVVKANEEQEFVIEIEKLRAMLEEVAENG